MRTEESIRSLGVYEEWVMSTECEESVRVCVRRG